MGQVQELKQVMDPNVRCRVEEMKVDKGRAAARTRAGEGDLKARKALFMENSGGCDEHSVAQQRQLDEAGAQ